MEEAGFDHEHFKNILFKEEAKIANIRSKEEASRLFVTKTLLEYVEKPEAEKTRKYEPFQGIPQQDDEL